MLPDGKLGYSVLAEFNRALDLNIITEKARITTQTTTRNPPPKGAKNNFSARSNAALLPKAGTVNAIRSQPKG